MSRMGWSGVTQPAQQHERNENMAHMEIPVKDVRDLTGLFVPGP